MFNFTTWPSCIVYLRINAVPLNPKILLKKCVDGVHTAVT